MSQGWFGEPWPSGVCYGEDGSLLEGSRVPFPDGQSCMWCEEPFADGDSGVQMPCVRTGGPTIEHIHKECMIRMTLGPVAHLEGRCRCHGGSDYAEPGMSKRQDALATWNWLARHGQPAVS